MKTIKQALLACLLFFFPSLLWAQTESTSLTLQQGTLIKVALQQDLNGKEASVGQPVNFLLSEDILLDNKVAIAKGAKVTGTITEAERSKALGKKGKLGFSIDYLYLPSGKTVKLRNEVQKNLNGSGAAVAAGAVLLTPAALLIPGKNAKYLKGEIFTAYIDSDVTIN
jgi:hypothetical protein